MSYQALYRKYRPSTLEDVIGQDVVIKILKNAIINEKVGHAYLFSGPRGIGKTSIAKAFAKTINCLDIKKGISCEKCVNCESINNGFCPDIIEIDAASNNGVDEIREIKNKISLVPNQLKYKVYIIDEVHMLSIGAFNALLKTLEEPPEHIIFILATTDPQKVPTTIISRCQCYEFHRISNQTIVNRLKYIGSQEKINVDNAVLERIAELSDGGMRDSIGMLDKLSAYSDSKITIEDFEKVNGIVSKEEKEKFVELVFESNVVEIISFLDKIYDNGKDLIIFVQDLLQICKNKCIDYYVKNSKVDIEFLLSFSTLLNDVLKNIKTSANVKTMLEINLLSFLNKKTKSALSAKPEEIVENKEKTTTSKKIEKESEKTISIEKNISQEIVSEENLIDNKKQIINNCFARASKKEKQMFESKWSSISDYALDSKFGAAASYVSDGKICAVGEGEVIISFSYESMANRGLNLLETIQKLFEKVYNKHYDAAFITDDEWESIRKEFIENKNKGINYEYIPIETKEKKLENSINKDDSITNQAIELFGDNVVSM